MIAIIDYGLGNLHSVAGAVEKLGFPVVVSSDIVQLQKAEKLIFPGVGAFADGMKNLRHLKLVEPLSEMVLRQKKAILGICLGFQLMSKDSFEFGHHLGLGWIDASVIRLNPSDNSLRVPHVGWNDLTQVNPCILFEGIAKDALFYYTHSYFVKPEDENLVMGQCDYGGYFTAALQNGNIYGTQFHPEKSQHYGLMLLKNFLQNGK